MKVWIVGRMHPLWAESGWSLVGIFATEAEARASAAIEDRFDEDSEPHKARVFREIEIGAAYSIDADSEGWI